MRNFKILSAVMLAIIFTQLQGCAVAAIVAAVKYGDSKKIEAKQGCLKDYNDYLRVAKHPIPLSKYCGNASYTNSTDK